MSESRLRPSLRPPDGEPGDHQRDADQHREGIVEDEARLHPPRETGSAIRARPHGEPVDDAVDRAAVTALPEEPPDPHRGPHEDQS